MDARSSYREAAVRGARPVQLVILLYETSIEALRRAITALEKNDVETRTREINHAVKVIGHLQASLDMERGGDVARNLSRFYQILRISLVEAQGTQSAKVLEEQISHLILVREAWAEVERADAGLTVAASAPAPSSADAVSESVSEWNA
jgi:flagellar secretion chaperone FliS